MGWHGEEYRCLEAASHLLLPPSHLHKTDQFQVRILLLSCNDATLFFHMCSSVCGEKWGVVPITTAEFASMIFGPYIFWKRFVQTKIFVFCVFMLKGTRGGGESFGNPQQQKRWQWQCQWKWCCGLLTLWNSEVINNSSSLCFFVFVFSLSLEVWYCL